MYIYTLRFWLKIEFLSKYVKDSILKLALVYTRTTNAAWTPELSVVKL